MASSLVVLAIMRNSGRRCDDIAQPWTKRASTNDNGTYRTSWRHGCARAITQTVSMLTRTQIRMARCAVGLSIRDLARATGLTATSIGHLENGRTNPKRSTLEAIERALVERGAVFEQRGDLVGVFIPDPDIKPGNES